MGLRDFLFGAQRDRSGRDLPFTRWDSVLGAACGLALLAACAYASELHDPRTPVRVLVLSAVLLGIALLAQNRRAVFGGGFAILCGRLIIGALLDSHHSGWLLLAALPAAAMTWALLRDTR